jgi:hypothetical protein
MRKVKIEHYILKGKRQIMREFKIPGPCWEHNIKISLEQLAYELVYWIILPQDIR